MIEFIQDGLVKYQSSIINCILHFASALTLLVVGFFLARLLSNSLIAFLKGRGIEPIVVDFSANLLKYAVVIVFLIAAIGQLGVQTTSLIAVLGAAGLAIGLALKDTLSNFASGVLLIVFRPIRAGEFVEVAGIRGTVSNLHIFSTTLVTADNKTVIMPNNQLFQGNIINFSRQGTRRIDLVIGVGYNSNLLKAKEILWQILNNDSRVLTYPEPVIGVADLGDSAVIINVRPWVKADDYWPVHYHLLETIKLTFDKEGMTIPFPQMDVHLSKTSKV